MVRNPRDPSDKKLAGYWHSWPDELRAEKLVELIAQVRAEGRAEALEAVRAAGERWPVVAMVVDRVESALRDKA